MNLNSKFNNINSYFNILFDDLIENILFLTKFFKYNKKFLKIISDVLLYLKHEDYVLDNNYVFD